jgi:hypothetical protein
MADREGRLRYKAARSLNYVFLGRKVAGDHSRDDPDGLKQINLNMKKYNFSSSQVT